MLELADAILDVFIAAAADEFQVGDGAVAGGYYYQLAFIFAVVVRRSVIIVVIVQQGFQVQGGQGEEGFLGDGA